MRHIIVSLVLLLVVVVYVFTPQARTPEPLQWLEFLAYDMRMQYAVRSEAAQAGIQGEIIEPRVVVVDIGESSQEKFGRWPWPRDLTAQLIETIAQTYQASWIGLDAHFPYHVHNGEVADQRLASVLQATDPVMALRLITTADAEKGVKAMRIGEAGLGALVQAVDGSVPDAQLGKAVGYIGNLPQFISDETIVGHITPIDDADSKKRRLDAVYRFDDRYFSTLSLALWRQSLGADGFVFDGHLHHWLDSPKWYLAYGGQPSPYYVPVNQNGEVLIPYRGRVETIPAADILEHRVPVSDVAGKFVLIGSSAEAQGDDLVATPLNPRLPGVEIHSAMLSAMLDQSMDNKQAFKIQPTNEPWLQVILLIVVTGVLLLARHFGVSIVLVVAPSLLLLWVVINYWLWAHWHLAIEVLPLVFLIVLIITYLVLSDLLDISARHEHVRKMFGFYLPKPVVERIANDKTGKDWLKPERRDMTVLFADMRGFTRMSEEMSPEAVANITFQLFTEMTDIIHHHGGTVDKYMGDAVMAFWGAPLEDVRHPLHAVQAAWAMQQALEAMNATHFNQQAKHIRLGIGINTGTMLVGNLGSERRHAYTVLGSEVNLASAIQQLTRESSYDILISEATAARLGGELCLDLGLLASKKFTHKVRVFTLNLDQVAKTVG